MSHLASLGAQTVKNLPAKQDTWVQSLGWKDPLEKVMATPLVGYCPWVTKHQTVLSD